jgi:nucleoside-diphosphate-sugar epimerase
MEGEQTGLTVAVTGPTGTFGFGLMPMLQADDRVERVIGIARRPFDPAQHGWTKMEYRRGDVRDPEALRAAFRGADVVVHLAFIVVQASERTRDINVEGSRNVFQAAVDAGVKRLVYTSSVAAYGFYDENPVPIDEDVPARGSDDFPYSAQKAELERVLAEATTGAKTDVYVFRPCIVAGPDARMMIDAIPYVKLGGALPGAVRRLFDQVPILKPVIPDPGVPFQLVHHDDVASALVAAVVGKGEPGVYNLAADDSLTFKEFADALGWYAIPVPELAVDATAEIVSRLPLMPAEAKWVEAGRTPVLMDSSKARKLLKWKPGHSSVETLQETVAAHREDLDGGA